MKRTLIFFLLQFILLFTCCIVCNESRSEEECDNCLINAYSYDWSDNLYWGFGGLVFDSYRSNEQLIDVNYVGMNSEKKQEVIDNPDEWLKAWIRFSIPVFLDDLSQDNSEYLTVQNVQIKNSDAIGIYCKSIAIQSGNNCIKGDQVSKTTNWYIELLIEKRDRNSYEIEMALKKAQVHAQVLSLSENNCEKKECVISLGDCFRDVMYYEGGVEFYCLGYHEVPIDTIDYNNICPNSSVLGIQNPPRNYSLIELEIYMNKHMPWGICSIIPKTFEVMDGVYFLYDSSEDSPIARNDYLEDGDDIPLIGFYLLVNIYGKKTKEQIDSILRDSTLNLEFSTEYAGEIYWDGETDGKWGFCGVRFVEDIAFHLDPET